MEIINGGQLLILGSGCEWDLDAEPKLESSGGTDTGIVRSGLYDNVEYRVINTTADLAQYFSILEPRCAIFPLVTPHAVLFTKGTDDKYGTIG